MTLRILKGDCRDVLPTLPADSVHCCVTSPPYWGLRDYGVAGQIGLEPTFTEFIDKMVEVFREVRRVLRPDGTLWLNLGDSYCSTAPGTMGDPIHQRGIFAGVSDRRAEGSRKYRPDTPSGLKPKDLCGIPWRVAFALQQDGWWLRQDIIWSKPNPMPESVTDRCTKAHEYLFLLTKSARYYFDAEAIKETQCQATLERAKRGGRAAGKIESQDALGKVASGNFAEWDRPRQLDPAGRNKRSVWEIATSPFPEAHFATFPPALVEPCIKAGTSEKGCCGKCGAPWERQVRDTEEYAAFKAAERERKGGGMRDNAFASLGLTRGTSNQSVTAGRVTAGWQPTCTCQAAVVPATVLDPFGGAGTTGLVADRLQRNAILIELNPTYAAMAEKRIFSDAPLFAIAAE